MATPDRPAPAAVLVSIVLATVLSLHYLFGQSSQSNQFSQSSLVRSTWSGQTSRLVSLLGLVNLDKSSQTSH